MNEAQLTADSSAHTMPTGLRSPTVLENRPLANSVPPRMTTAAPSSAGWGRRRVAITWKTMPIHVNWNSSVMATDTGSMVSA